MSEKSLGFEESLEYQFLYNNDPNSIYILLSWLDNRSLYSNLIPKYTINKELATGLRRSLGRRRDKESIVQAIMKLISDDINRLELAFIIKAYRKGYYDYRRIDELEKFALSCYSPSELADKRILFHNVKNDEVRKIKQENFDLLLESEDMLNIKVYVKEFLEKNIKKKIFNINQHIDKQIVVDYANLGILTTEGSNLTINELQNIYNKISYYVTRSLKMAYKNQYWYALNDAVIRRYI